MFNNKNSVKLYLNQNVAYIFKFFADKRYFYKNAIRNE
jgi:hypothetical protein